MIFRDVHRTTIESFFRSIGDLRDTDLREKLPTLDIPTLGIYGINDNIVSPTNANILRENTKNVQISMMHHSRHFPMTDEPVIFKQAVDRFLSHGILEKQNGHVS